MTANPVLTAAQISDWLRRRAKSYRDMQQRFDIADVPHLAGRCRKQAVMDERLAAAIERGQLP